MYILRGADDVEHGPLAAREVRDWIATGRAGRDTPAHAVNESGWRPLSQFIEFESYLTGPAATNMETDVGRPRTYRLLSMVAFTLSVIGASILVTIGAIIQGRPNGPAALCALLCLITAIPALGIGIVARILARIRPREFGGQRLANAAIIISLVWLTAGPGSLYLGFLKLRRGAMHGDDTYTHVRSLTMSLRVISIANNGAFPDANSWCDAIRKEVTSTNHYQCPDDPKHAVCAFAYNSKLSGVKNPAPDTVALFESDLGWNGSGGPADVTTKPHHGNRVLVGFVSGGFRAVETNKLSQLRWDP